MEWPKNDEKEVPTVTLHFMRHSIKAGASADMTDQQIPLTDQGRELAAKKLEAPLDMRFSHVAGSSRVRTHETAVIAATQNPAVTPNEFQVGKVRSLAELDFDTNEADVYGRRFADEYRKGRLLPFLIKESDALAKESGDTTSSTYSRMAANIAKLIERTYEAASRGASILEQSHNTDNEKNDFERVFVTHASIQESFLLKLVEKMKGESARDELLSKIGDNGFEYVEGFDTTLSKKNGEIQVRITYKKGDYSFDEVVPQSVLEEIIKEGE
jgi:broad specificity phosphatase PhoE